LFVRASAGSIRPIVVVKVTTVPLCTGVPAPGDEVEVGVVGVVGVPGVVGVLGAAAVDPCSMTVATISIDPFEGTVVAVPKMVMTLPVGANSGTLSQDVEKTVAERQASAVRTLPTPRALRRAVCASIGKPKHNSRMGLQRQYGEHGYAMAALLVSLAVMSVLMTAALPAWRQQAKREKEAELVFRGEQYVRAIRLWEMKMGPGTRPPSFDILVQQKFLRKKYKDPMTEDGEFQPLFAGVNLPMQPGGAPSGRGGPSTGRGAQPQQIAPQPMQQPGRGGIPTQMGGGGILGVVSKSKEASIRIYKGGTHYNEWNFIYANASTAPGGRGATMPGGRGGSPFPGGRGPDGRGRGFGPGMGPGRGFGPQGPTVTPTSPSGRGGR
jgi:type II secretory pathway pseudopilin PulG